MHVRMTIGLPVRCRVAPPCRPCIRFQFVESAFWAAASFRSRLAADTLAFGSWFRSSQSTEESHLRESYHAWSTRNLSGTASRGGLELGTRQRSAKRISTSLEGTHALRDVREINIGVHIGDIGLEFRPNLTGGPGQASEFVQQCGNITGVRLRGTVRRIKRRLHVSPATRGNFQRI